MSDWLTKASTWMGAHPWMTSAAAFVAGAFIF
jgi:hypothetical protein